MNILPFVVTILMVLSLFSLSQFRNSMSPETTLYISYFKTLREARNQLARDVYLKHHVKKDKKQKNVHVEKKENSSTTPYFRHRNVGAKEGRLSLLPLLKGEDDSGVLKELALKYFRMLYGHLPGYRETLLLQILEKQKEYYLVHNETIPCYGLMSEMKNIDDFEYRVFRGTHAYDPEAGIGFPPFEHAFSYDGDGIRAIQFSYAPKMLLGALFSPELADEIEEIEYADQVSKNGRRTPCSAEKLTAKANGKMIPNTHLKLELIDFSAKKESKRFVETDLNTQITVWAEPLSES